MPISPHDFYPIITAPKAQSPLLGRGLDSKLLLDVNEEGEGGGHWMGDSIFPFKTPDRGDPLGPGYINVRPNLPSPSKGLLPNLPASKSVTGDRGSRSYSCQMPSVAADHYRSLGPLPPVCPDGRRRPTPNVPRRPPSDRPRRGGGNGDCICIFIH